MKRSVQSARLVDFSARECEKCTVPHCSQLKGSVEKNTHNHLKAVTVLRSLPVTPGGEARSSPFSPTETTCRKGSNAEADTPDVKKDLQNVIVHKKSYYMNMSWVYYCF